jgi:crossover junction endodeoxyribonuclease RusA
VTYDLSFEYPTPPLSLNQRLHHLDKARRTAQIRQDTNRLGQGIPRLGRCDVTLIWYVTDRRRRDAENPVPTLKAMCDELVTLGVVPDDTPEFMVKHMPVIEWTAEGPAHMVLSVRRLPPLADDSAATVQDRAVAA